MQIKINKMNLSDLDKISDKLISEFDDFWNYNVFKSELENENSKYIVATENDEIVGFAGIWIAIDEAHITNIVTKKSYRNKGIGNLLLENLINLSCSLNLNSITLEVKESNIPAIKLYEKFDFKNLGIRKNYYNNCENAIIMTKYLK
jgi:ribosomal-protein-alanine N-acetyltransferase